MARTRRTPKAHLDRLVDAIGEGHTISTACDIANVSRTVAYQRRREDPEFAARWAEALERGTELLEAEARRRAMGGSDTLLIFLLKARRPEVYRDSHHVRIDGSVKVDAGEAAVLQRVAREDPAARDALVAAAKVMAGVNAERGVPVGLLADGAPTE